MSIKIVSYFYSIKNNIDLAMEQCFGDLNGKGVKFKHQHGKCLENQDFYLHALLLSLLSHL